MADRPVFNDRYEVHSRIGRGGMADVFLARDRLLDRPVAVKVLFPEYATDPSFVERFRREAQSAANLNHPNVVGVYDWGRQGGTYFIVMEYVNGRTLADLLRADGPLGAQRAAEIAADVASALGFAHRSGVVHRDVKPANILIATSGAVKVADFGIARALNSATEQDLTQAGAVMGTATYFSPEQAQGATPDPRSDLYSLGIVMYEMLAGRPPFTGDNPVAIAYRQVHDQPRPLSQVQPNVPRPYEAITTKLLAKNPADRYPSADDLRADLQRFRDGQPVLAAGAGPGGMAAAAAAAAAAGAAATAPTPVTRPADAPTVATPAAVAPTQAVRPVATPAQREQYAQVARPADGGQFSGGRVPPSRPPLDDDRGRGGAGWWVTGGLFAVVLIGIGAFLLLRALNDTETTPGDFITVPDVRLKTRDEARDLIARAGLQYKEEAQATDSVQPGLVWDQRPARGNQVLRNDTVTVVYNPAKQTVALPSLVGTTKDQAVQILASLGLKAQFKDAESPDRPAGTVLAQDPAPGDIPAGATVTITISVGKGKVTVPNVLNLDQAVASNQLGAAGLVAKVAPEASPTVPTGAVVRTDPPVGTEVDKGSAVTLVVSSGPAPVEVPKLVGLTESAARDKLQELGLKASVTTTDVPNGSEQAGKVILQGTPETTKVPPGSTVTLTVGKALPPTTTTTIATTTTTTTTTTTPTTTGGTTTTTQAKPPPTPPA
jgi:serine/threonine-protein kinase